MMKITSLSLFFILFSLSLTAQEKSIEELKKNYPDQPAVIEYQKVSYEFEQPKGKKEEESPEAREVTVEKLISLKKHSNIMRTRFYDDYSTRPEVDADINIEQSCGSYQQKNIFHSDVKVCVFNLSSGPEGNKPEYQFEQNYFDLKYLTRIYLSEDLPILKKEVVFHIPDWLEAEIAEYNFDSYDITIKEEKSNEGRVIRIVARNLEPMKSESYSAGASYTYPHVLVLFKAFKDKKDNYKKIISSNQDLYSWYSGLVKQVKNNPEKIKETVNELTSGKNQEEKIRSIYYYVQDKIRYIAFENGIAGYKPESASRVLENRYGDCKGMANLTKEMLSMAGFDARLGWIGTSSIPYNFSTPSLAINNHMICILKYKGETYFLDPTEKYCSFGDVAERIQGRQVMIENGESFIIDTVPVTDHRRNLTQTDLLLEINENEVTGSGKKVYRGESKTKMLYTLNHTDHTTIKSGIRNYLSEGEKNVKVSNITYSDVNDRISPFTMTYDVVFNNKVFQFEKDLYINLDLNTSFKDFDIEEDRISDLYFGKKMNRSFSATYKLPPGYNIKHLPESFNISTEDFTIELNVKESGGQVGIERKVIVPDGSVRKENFEEWNRAIEKLRAFYDDTIIISSEL